MQRQTHPQILPIAERGEPVLQGQAQAITDLHDPSLQTLIEDMQATMLAANGVGIAAPQVFAPLRLIIVASRPNPRYPDAPLMEPLAMLNPEILWQSDDTSLCEEGCLSVPEVRAPVPRANRLQLRYFTRDGESVVAEYDGFIARIIQHECDHLDGVLFPDRVDDADKIVSEATFKHQYS